MRKTVLTEEAGITLKRLESKDPGLKQLLKKAYGYVVFPSVGKAAAVLGGAYGHGVVFEQGKRIGFATISQMTVGVQLGGDTFSELLIFNSRQAMSRFKRGKLAWAANASAVLVRAGAGGTADHEKDVTALAYSRGGMMLELGIGGQKFKFRPLDAGDPSERGEEENTEDNGSGSEDQANGSDNPLMNGAREAVARAGTVARQHPVITSIAGASVAAGLALLVARAVRRSGAAGDREGSGEEDYDERDDQENEEGSYADAEDEADSGAEDEEETDEGNEEAAYEGDEEEGQDRGRGGGRVQRQSGNKRNRAAAAR
jgi:hypothetical protein